MINFCLQGPLFHILTFTRFIVALRWRYEEYFRQKPLLSDAELKKVIQEFQLGLNEQRKCIDCWNQKVLKWSAKLHKFLPNFAPNADAIFEELRLSRRYQWFRGWIGVFPRDIARPLGSQSSHTGTLKESDYHQPHCHASRASQRLLFHVARATAGRITCSE